MNEVILSLLKTNIIQTILMIFKIIFIVAVIETFICIVLAMRFNIRNIKCYRNCFSNNYNIITQRNSVSWKESKNNWFLWLSVVTGNCRFNYEPLVDSKIITNIVLSLKNVFRFIIMYLLTPIYILFFVCSYIERIYRIFLGFFGFFIFWILAKSKIIISYHLNTYIINIKSNDSYPTCTIDILYRKPIIKIYLFKPQDYIDSKQKDNINHFIVSLKEILPKQKSIKFKVLVYYSDGENGMKKDLPMTYIYLRMIFKNITVKYSEIRRQL